VTNGRYAHAENALPREKLSTDLKLEEVVPSAKALERGVFGWHNPMKGLSYTMVWQPTIERQSSKKPRGSYDVTTLGQGSRMNAAPALIQARSNDAAERGSPLVVYLLSADARQSYATAITNTVQTIAAMITARINKITFVQFDEHHADVNDTRARTMDIHPCILGLIRSCRLEAPNINIGFVGGDMPSWMCDPAPMIERIFDVVEGEESEVIFQKGDSYAPLLVGRDMDLATRIVKPGLSDFLGSLNPGKTKK